MKKLRTNLGMAGLLCLMMFIFTTVSFAQGRATLTGSVTDSEDGSPLAGANIVLIGTTIGAASGGGGNFTVSNIPPGTYTVKVSFIGYEVSETTGVLFAAGETKTMDFALVVSGIQFNAIVATASRRPEKTLDAPASISVVELKEINQLVAPSSASLLANVTGVDMATTGVDRREIVMRGFNNAFSGAAYILTDNRRAAVPSLDVNLHSIMPNMAIDLERVEVVRGPGSALYGAGVDAGVIHYISKDPFTHPGTTVSFSGGERSSFAGHFRHAAALTDNVGFKVTGQYAQADDWEYDANDPLDAAQLESIEDIPGLSFNRDYEKINVNGLLEFKLGDQTRLIANGGYSSLTATVLSGIGTVQADGYGYSYGQLRLQSGSFFAQAYLNKNNAGDSFVYGQLTADDAGATPVVDNSIVFNSQAQYDMELMDGKQQLIFGVDYDRTTPDTKGTIFDDDLVDLKIEEFGVYAQSTTALSEQLDLTAALRADYNNIEEDFQFSPRGALVFKPSPQHSFRATYNRAYALPGGNSLFLNIVGARIPITGTPFSLVQRGRGSKDGFHFNNATSGGGITASSLFPAPDIFGEHDLVYSAPGVPTQNVPLAPLYGLIYSTLAATPLPQLQAILMANGVNLPDAVVSQFITLLSPVEVTPGVPFTDVQGNGTSILAAAPEDIEPLKSTITQTLEAGYKGLINEKMLFAVDVYYSKKKNFVSGVTQATPLAGYGLPNGQIPILDDNELAGAIAAAITANPALGPALGGVGLTSAQVAGLLVGIADADLRTLMSSLPAGVVQPDENAVPGEILGAYRNFGDIDFWGVDATLQILATNNLNLFGNISYVSDDFFDNDELGETNPAIFQALNSTKFKAKGGFSYDMPNGFTFNGAGRYTKAFPVASGPYIGGLPITVAGDIGGLDNYFLLDVGAGFDFSSYASGLRLDFTVQNVLDNKHREFIGAPEIGRLALARLTYSR